MSINDTVNDASSQEQATKWIFRYIRADRAEIDMGPYTTQEEALEERDKFAGLGATCSNPIEVKADYQLFQDEVGE